MGKKSDMEFFQTWRRRRAEKIKNCIEKSEKWRGIDATPRDPCETIFVLGVSSMYIPKYEGSSFSKIHGL